jgi:hypothetical protein
MVGADRGEAGRRAASWLLKSGRGSKQSYYTTSIAARSGVRVTDILYGLLARAVRQAESLDLRLRIAQLLLLDCTQKQRR